MRAHPAAPQGEVGEAEGLAQHHREPRYLALPQRLQEPDRPGQQIVMLDVLADHEARRVLQEDQGNVEGIAQAEEMMNV